MSRELFTRIAKQSQAATAPGPWSFLRRVSSIRKLPFADPAFLEELRDEFSTKQLEAERVLVRRRENHLILNPVLTNKSSQGLFLRLAKGDAPFDIVNERGSLLTSKPPAFECVRDYATKHCSRDVKCVLVANSDDDLAVLRMLGLPCTPAAGLGTMDGKRLRSLFGFGFESSESTISQTRSEPVVSGGYKLVMMAWSIATLDNDTPRGIDSIVERLVDAEDAIGIDTSRRVAIWQPTAENVNKIRTAAKLRDEALARRLVWQDIKHSACSARQFRERADSRNPVDYAIARQKLLSTIKRTQQLGYQSPAVAKNLEALHRSYDKDVVDALIEDAMATTDLVDRSLLLAASELMQQLHRLDPLVRSTQDAVRGRYTPKNVAIHPSEQSDLLRAVDSLSKIQRALMRNQ